MEGISPRRKREEGSNPKRVTDRISDLPDCVIVEILYHLSTEDAIRTAALSKRWRSLWTQVPGLHFDLDRRNGRPGLRFVERTLASVPSPKTFSLRYFGYKNRLARRMDSLLHLAATRHVEHICLAISSMCAYSYRLPEHIYSNGSLRMLTISGCDWLPMGRVSWDSLRVLVVQQVILSDDVLATVLAGCPSLESLMLLSTGGVGRVDIGSPKLKDLIMDTYDPCNDYPDNLRICAPYLKELAIMGEWSKTPKLIDVRSLVTVKLDFYDDTANWNEMDETQKSVFKHILEIVGHAKLHIGPQVLEAFSDMEINTNAPRLSGSKSLVIEFEFFLNDGIFNILQCSPILEELNIIIPSKCYSFQKSDLGRYPRKPPGSFECLACHLKVVHVLGLFDDDNLFEFLEFLLKHALVLKEMVVLGPRFKTKEDRDRLLKRVLDLPRSSPNVVFLTPDIVI